MRIIIDLQSAQTEIRFSSIGRHSLALSKAMVRNRGGNEIIIVLSSLFPETIEPLRAEFDPLLPQENIRVWHIPDQIPTNVPQNSWRHQSAQLVREAFIASLQPDIVHIMSMVEDSDAIISIGFFDKLTPISVSLYDLARLPGSDDSTRTEPAQEQHLQKNTDYLGRASQLLVTSKVLLHDKKENPDFGLHTPQMINISMLADKRFHPATPTKQQVKAVTGKFDLSRSIVLISIDTGALKGLLSIIKAYAKLSDELQKTHQLVFAGNISERNMHELRSEAKTTGLHLDDLVFTRCITDDELATLYNISKLFAYPSSSDRCFGLPVLEAMSCGLAVTAPNTSVMLEITGRNDILFEPENDEIIAEIFTRVLTDDEFRSELEQHNLEHAGRISQTEIAAQVLSSFEKIHIESQKRIAETSSPADRPNLAFVSPLPPERSGISDYSAELIPELSQHYNIDIVVSQDAVQDSWHNANCKIRSVDWFRSHANCYERVLYHFGNSPFHLHMFGLLEEIPGIVVLHDFFLANIVAHMDTTNYSPNIFTKELYRGHGYNAVQELHQSNELSDVVWKYPCNYSVLDNALGIVVHSEYPKRLAKHWYPLSKPDNWAVVPLLRTPAVATDRIKARHTLKLNENDFVICSFGVLGPIKLNHRLLEAWLASDLSKDKNCVLIFVGDNNMGTYEHELLSSIKKSKKSEQIRITEWVDSETFHNYLAATDICVQLRAKTRGETSAAILDCMNYALPTIVNADGSTEELPDETLWKLPKEFNNNQLIEALETLWQDKERRDQLGEHARNTVLEHHSPKNCAAQYSKAIENFYTNAQTDISNLTKAIGTLDDHNQNDSEYIALAESIAHNLPDKKPCKQLLLDISVIYRLDLKTGIQRVIRAILFELVNNPPENYQVEPVYLSDIGGHWHYRYARNYTFGLLECPTDIIADEPIDSCPEDIVISLDLYYAGPVIAREYLDMLHRDGIKIYFLVFDLLPVLLPHMFPAGTSEEHANWLKAIARYDGGICISKAVADELSTWVNKYCPKMPRPFNISHFHLGADIKNSAPSYGIPGEAHILLEALHIRPSFLMVGTIEPRKGHAQVMAAFDQLWTEGIEANLIIIGKQGWDVEELIAQLQNRKETGLQLHWLQDVSDEYLDKIYEKSTCLIAASEGEGFGLPLIESARHKLPIIARDITVFHEVANENAFYFKGNDATTLNMAIQKWLSLYKLNQHPRSDSIPWLTWSQSADELLLAANINRT